MLEPEGVPPRRDVDSSAAAARSGGRDAASAGHDPSEAATASEGPEAPDAGAGEVGETFRESLAQAARRAGFGSLNEGGAISGRSLIQAIGGLRGILETLLPSLLFVLLFSFTQSLPLSLAVSVGAAAVFAVARLVQRGPVTQALGGLIAALASAGLALFTGRAEDNFLIGLFTNGAYGAVFLVTVLIGWPLIGLAVGFLLGEGTSWRRDKRKFRAMQWITLAWALLFLVRLGVQLPFYLSGQVELLGTLKLVMGLPLYAPLLVLSWFVVRATFLRGGARPAEHELG